MSTLFGAHFASPDDWERARRVARPLLPAVAAALEGQNAAYEASPARQAHLRALRSGAAAVLTGQQTGLFLGPLYTLHKAATAIRLARQLTTRWQAPVVPVFWLQTEDHDAAEIAVCHVARGSADPLTLRLDVDAEAISVSRRVLPEQVAELLATLSGEIARLPHAAEHLALLARHYRPGNGWGKAFAGVLAALFAEEGLVLIDPHDPALAASAAPVHRKALVASSAIAAALTERVRALESAGFHAGVYVRDDAPLSFFHPAGPAGPRRRLAAIPGGFTELGGHATRLLPELLGILEREPARFSTSALLRPILQDTWFPTAAYVGGPAEVAYFAQLAPAYAAFGVPMPIVVPRAQVRLIERATRQALARRGMTAAEATRPFDEALRLAGEPAGNEARADGLTRRVVEGIERVLAEVAPDVRDAGPGASKALAKTRKTMARAAAKLGTNVDKAWRLRDHETVDDLRLIQARLLPGGVPQERYFGLPSFAARYGQRAVVERVLAAAEPLCCGFTDVEL